MIFRSNQLPQRIVATEDELDKLLSQFNECTLNVLSFDNISCSTTISEPHLGGTPHPLELVLILEVANEPGQNTSSSSIACPSIVIDFWVVLVDLNAWLKDDLAGQAPTRGV